MKDFTSLGERLLAFALSVLATAWLLSVAWLLMQPLLPVLAVGAVVLMAISSYVRRRREW